MACGGLGEGREWRDEDGWEGESDSGRERGGKTESRGE